MQRISVLMAVFLATPAFAGGVTPSLPQRPVVTTDAQWTGGYAGLQFGSVDGESAGAGDAEFDGTLYGLFAGYRHDFGAVTGGVELDFMVGDGDFTPINPAGPVFGIDYNRILRVGAELGYDAGQVLPYATVGYAFLNLGRPVGDATGNGYFYGMGLDVRVTERVTIGAELLQHEFSDFNNTANNQLDVLTFGLNVAFTF